MNATTDIEQFIRRCARRLRSLRTRESAALDSWPDFASYAPSEFDPSSWPRAVRQTWQTLCLAVYASRGEVFVPNDLFCLMGDVPRFTEALTGIDSPLLKDVALVRGYALCPPGLADPVPGSMDRAAVALVVSKAGHKPKPLLVPVFDADDVEGLRRLSERHHLVGDLRAFSRAGWVQPAQVALWNVHPPARHGPNTDGSARKFREDVAAQLDRVLPDWFPAPIFGSMGGRSVQPKPA